MERRSFLRACLAAGGLAFVPKLADRYRWRATSTGLVSAESIIWTVNYEMWDGSRRVVRLTGTDLIELDPPNGARTAQLQVLYPGLPPAATSLTIDRKPSRRGKQVFTARPLWEPFV